ncbi:MAG: HEAT repeat domain-containing protein, partial [Acidimicrobiales bacterium]|nr:HEAT repeat domain-containing protein [Acidimicrobiales bacterium]
VDYLVHDDQDGTSLALEVAANLPEPELLRSFARHAVSDDPLRRRMVASALGSGCSTDCDRLLAGLLDDADETVRTAAAEAAGRVAAESLATTLGRCLGDSSWNVRREAGQALEHLGAVGTLVLRSHLRDPDLFARDMARQSLDAISARRASMLPIVEEALVADVDDWVPVDRQAS